jgi:hypothetical protein
VFFSANVEHNGRDKRGETGSIEIEPKIEQQQKMDKMQEQKG